MVAADGGVFAFGTARFAGSTANLPLAAPINGIVADPDGTGYWLIATDGGGFAFDTAFRGSMGGQPLNAPVTGAINYGDGYLLVAADGGIFTYSNRDFLGSLGGQPLTYPVITTTAPPD